MLRLLYVIFMLSTSSVFSNKSFVSISSIASKTITKAAKIKTRATSTTTTVPIITPRAAAFWKSEKQRCCFVGGVSSTIAREQRQTALIRRRVSRGTLKQEGQQGYYTAIRVPSFSSTPTLSASFRLFSTAEGKMTSENEVPEQDDNIQAKIVHFSEHTIQECGERLRNGDLVAFPTETVYGLGCNALDPTAIKKVFQAKERPFTDPLIIHVVDYADAYRLWEATATTTPDAKSSIEEAAIKVLCTNFWPGPLTIVAKAAASGIVPDEIMANTGFVAIRAPQLSLAKQLIKEAKVPIAAPSANKFGHVSPTSPYHVYDDLKHEDVYILSEEADDTSNKIVDNDLNNNKKVGVESTVAKILYNDETDELLVTVLRQGAISESQLRRCLHDHNDDKKNKSNSSIRVISNIQHSNEQDDNKQTNKDSQNGEDNTKKNVANLGGGDDDASIMVSPGQLIKHYSPKIPSYLISLKSHQVLLKMQSQQQQTRGELSAKSNDSANDEAFYKEYLSSTVVIDYNASLICWKPWALKYFDLTSTNNSSEAARTIFETLRQAENIDGARRILFPDLGSVGESNAEDDSLRLAVQDKLTRAASGVVLDNFSLD